MEDGEKQEHCFICEIDEVYAEYDEVYGKPLGVATQTAEGWSRELSGCSVAMHTAGTNATITMKSKKDNDDTDKK